MANPAPMGPPQSPREIRRSGRRSAQSASASGSKSPDSPVSESAVERSFPAPGPRTVRETMAFGRRPRRPSLSASSSNGRSKRLKQEDIDDPVGEDMTPSGTPATTTTTNGRGKRKVKEKAPLTADIIVEPASDVLGDEIAVEAEEEPSVTRCVCGSNVDEEGEFMVQCETCDVWQHGLCVGYEDEEQVANISYYCEECRPDLHQDLLKQLAKRARQSSANSHHNASVTSRLSRSHSPSHLLKPAKRRNTMNSRDAAFDESLKEIIEATAAEAAAHDRGPSASRTINGNGETIDDGETGPGGRKKRKRTDDDTLPKKRTRSASSASEHITGSNTVRDDETPLNGGSKSHSASVSASKGHLNARKQRGGRKPAAVQEIVVSIEGDEGARPIKPRAKPGPVPKRPPPSVPNASGSASHEHGTRRNNNGVNGSTPHGSHAGGASSSTSAAEASRAYKNSHAYAVSQQPLFTSWNLPDYLAHLEPMLPTDTPKPLEVRASGVGPGGRESLERGLERGAKVKWPSKRMSVGDMNKRVRALVEWVGREQAGAADRRRRREALDKALRENAPASVIGADGESMAIDSSSRPSNNGDVYTSSDLGGAASTMKQMEELMEELISFQERFGPGAKIMNDRGRRITSG